jgi:hypothetical protein
MRRVWADSGKLRAIARMLKTAEVVGFSLMLDLVFQ